MALEARIFCGHHEIDFHEALSCAPFMRLRHLQHIDGKTTRSGPLGDACAFWMLIKRYQSERNVRLGVLMTWTTTRRTSDLRDKVYGILGMHSPGNSEDSVLQLIAPRYNKPAEEVLRDAMRYAFLENTEWGLYTLNNIYHRNEDHLGSGAYPSWVKRRDLMFDENVR